jgi:hypothetical protein
VGVTVVVGVAVGVTEAAILLGVTDNEILGVFVGVGVEEGDANIESQDKVYSCVSTSHTNVYSLVITSQTK